MSTSTVTGEATFSNARPPEGFSPDANAWKVTLRYQRRRMTGLYYTGSAITEFSAADVLESLILDASAGESTFEDFCADMGYDTDSRRAEQTWKACQLIAPKLRRLLGEDYDRLAYSSPDEWPASLVSRDRIN